MSPVQNQILQFQQDPRVDALRVEGGWRTLKHTRLGLFVGPGGPAAQTAKQTIKHPVALDNPLEVQTFEFKFSFTHKVTIMVKLWDIRVSLRYQTLKREAQIRFKATKRNTKFWLRRGASVVESTENLWNWKGAAFRRGYLLRSSS